MVNSFVKHDHCRLCNDSNVELVLHLTPTPVADLYLPENQVIQDPEEFPLDLYLCNHCGHVQLLHIVNADLLYNDYIYETSNSPGLVNHFKQYSEWTLANVSVEPHDLAIDIGSNDGTLLKFFKEAGLEVLGVDPAQNIAKRASQIGIETLPVFFTDSIAKGLKLARGPAKIITANNVIANINDINDFIEGIKSLLAEDGIFVFETGYLASLVKNSVFDNVYHEHISYHSVKPLISLFEEHGLKLAQVQTVDTKGGSLRGIAQHTRERNFISTSVTRFKNQESQLGLYHSDTYRSLGNELNKVKSELLNLLNHFKDEGKTVAGYGASHSVTTLIYHFDLAEHISFLVDDNQIKHNTFSPGKLIPVLPPSAIYEQNPDYVLILPWRFSQLIISNHETYLQNGGHFVTLLPEVSIV